MEHWVTVLSFIEYKLSVHVASTISWQNKKKIIKKFTFAIIIVFDINIALRKFSFILLYMGNIFHKYMSYFTENNLHWIFFPEKNILIVVIFKYEPKRI